MMSLQWYYGQLSHVSDDEDDQGLEKRLAGLGIVMGHDVVVAGSADLRTDPQTRPL